MPCAVAHFSFFQQKWEILSLISDKKDYERLQTYRAVTTACPEEYNSLVVLKSSFEGRWVRRWRRKAWRLANETLAFLRHPRGMTCLECGFLALNDREVSKADRVLLACSGEAGCPPLNQLRCVRKLWVNYDLQNFENSRDGLFEEIQQRRRPCEGFLRYRPGWSPDEHKELLQARLDRREKIIISSMSAIGASVLTLLGAWLLKLWGLK